jgi:hypothetical protein
VHELAVPVVVELDQHVAVDEAVVVVAGAADGVVVESTRSRARFPPTMVLYRTTRPLERSLRLFPPHPAQSSP